MGDASIPLPTLRWGVLGTGWISTMFITDLLVNRPDAPVKHVITALGSSSVEKGNSFVHKVWSASDNARPTVYESYQSVYEDPNVDIIYVGTPHSLHKENCLSAIAAGKHVLCEKPFTINATEAQEVVNAARSRGVFCMEAMWTRFNPLFETLLDHLYVKHSIGDVQRLFIDFGNYMPLSELPANSRLRDPALGAGALLDIGIYTLTYASVILGNGKVGKDHQTPEVISSLSIRNDIDEESVVILKYKEGKLAGGEKTAICTSSFNFKSAPDFARIEGSHGVITIFGIGASIPSGFRVRQKRYVYPHEEVREETYTFEHPIGTLGFYREADSIAQDIAHGNTENRTMPLDETLRMMELMDNIRKKNGLVYPQDIQ